MEIENNITKNMPLRVFLSFLRTKTLKHIQNTYYEETEQDFEKPVFLCVFLSLLPTNAKAYETAQH